MKIKIKVTESTQDRISEAQNPSFSDVGIDVPSNWRE